MTLHASLLPIALLCVAACAAQQGQSASDAPPASTAVPSKGSQPDASSSAQADGAAPSPRRDASLPQGQLTPALPPGSDTKGTGQPDAQAPKLSQPTDAGAAAAPGDSGQRSGSAVPDAIADAANHLAETGTPDGGDVATDQADATTADECRPFKEARAAFYDAYREVREATKACVYDDECEFYRPMSYHCEEVDFWFPTYEASTVKAQNQALQESINTIAAGLCPSKPAPKGCLPTSRTLRPAGSIPGCVNSECDVVLPDRGLGNPRPE